MDKKLFNQIVELSGLRPDVVGDLIDKGWTFRTSEEGPAMWVSPSAGIPDYIPHKEPHCDGSCGNQAPHLHGFPCFRACEECFAVCHPDCPAYKEN